MNKEKESVVYSMPKQELNFFELCYVEQGMSPEEAKARFADDVVQHNNKVSHEWLVDTVS